MHMYEYDIHYYDHDNNHFNGAWIYNIFKSFGSKLCLKESAKEYFKYQVAFTNIFVDNIAKLLRYTFNWLLDTLMWSTSRYIKKRRVSQVY